LGLQFGEHADVVFERAPLVVVLCQVKFSPVLSLMTAPGIAGFQTALRSDYPKFLEPQQNTSFALGPNSIGVKASAPLWRLADEDERWTVGLSADFVSLETPAYTQIDDFLSRMDRILTVLHRTVRTADATRVGLRKINKIQIEGANTSEFVGVIRPELLGPLAVESFPAPISGESAHLQFQEDDNTLVVRTGLEFQDGVMGFVIDMDYFTERPLPVDGGEPLIGLLRHFSEGMTSFFHWAVEDEYKPNLGPTPRQGDKAANE